MEKKEKKLTYDQWKTEIIDQLVKIGFPKNDARRKSNNYAGYWYDSTHYLDPTDVVNKIMQKGREMYNLHESAIYNWEKQTGLSAKLRFDSRR